MIRVLKILPHGKVVGPITAPENMAPPGQEKENSKVVIGKDVKKTSWVQVGQNDAGLSAHIVAVNTVDGKEMVEVPDAVIQRSVQLWDDLIEGRFL